MSQSVQDQEITHSKLLKKKLPKFEAPRDYAAYMEEDERIAKGEQETRADVVFETAYKESVELQNKEDRTPAETLDSILTCIGAQNSLREILFKTLRFCEQTRAFEEVEQFIAQSDEAVHSHIIQTPYALIQMLKHCGGLEEVHYDADDNELTPERTQGMTEDEIDELYDHAKLTTTEVGSKAIDLITPEKRFNSLINQRPHRRDTFYALMELCREPRTFPEIQEWYKQTPGLAVDTVQVHHTLAPDFYVDKLEKAGVLVWTGAWVLSPEGEELLAQYTAPEE